MKTFAELKRATPIGTKIMMTYASYPNRLLNSERYVVKSNSVGWEFSTDKNATRGSFLDYPKACLTEFDGDTFNIYEPLKRPLTAQEQEILDNEPSKRKENRDKVEYDMLSDGSQMYYADKSYIKESACPWLNYTDYVQGKRLESNGGLGVIDTNMKGTLLFTYKLN
jgi:hypothetical protein